jgi:hypothetical protein
MKHNIMLIVATALNVIVQSAVMLIFVAKNYYTGHKPFHGFYCFLSVVILFIVVLNVVATKRNILIAKPDSFGRTRKPNFRESLLNTMSNQ